MYKKCILSIAFFMLSPVVHALAVPSHTDLGQLVEGFDRIDPIDPGDTMGINRPMVYWPAAGTYHFNENLGQRRSWWAWEEEEVAWLTAPCPEKKQTTFAFAALNGADPGWIELYVNDHYAITFESGVAEAARWERGPYRLSFRLAGRQDGNNGVYYLTVPAADIVAGEPAHLRVKVVLQRDLFGNQGWKAYQLRPYPYYGGLLTERDRMSRNQCYFTLRDIGWPWSLRTDVKPLEGEHIMPLAFDNGESFPPADILNTLVDDTLPLRETPRVCLGQIEEEPTLERAWLQWPEKPRRINFLGETDAWAEFEILWNGMMAARGVGKDSEMNAKHSVHKLQVTLGTGAIPDFYAHQMDWQMEQSRLDGYLPGIVSTWERGGLQYEMTTISRLYGADEIVRGDENQVLLSRITVTNASDQPQQSDLWFSFTAPYFSNCNTYPQVYFREIKEPTHPLHYRDGVLVNDEGGVRAVVSGDLHSTVAFFGKEGQGPTPADGEKSVKAIQQLRDRGLLNSVVRVSALIPAKQSRQATLKLLHLPTEDDQAEALKKLDFDHALASYRTAWTARLNKGAQLITPEPFINEMWKAGLGDVYISGDRVPGLDMGIMKVSPCLYDSSHAICAEMAMSLDYRGLHRDAERYLEPFLRWQGQMEVWPGYQSPEGVLGVPSKMSWINWTCFNGWILRALVEHARLSGDEAWYKRALPRILASCDWLINELQATRDATHPSGAPVAGLLPKGRWTDDPSEDHYYGFADTHNYGGLKATADLLAAKGHPRSEELLAEAETYRQAIARAARWAAAHTRRFRARGGEEIPFVPAGLLKRRVVLHPWYIVECASMNMIPFGVINPKDELADWMLRVAEETPSCMRYGVSTSEPCYGPQRYAYLHRGEHDKFIQSFYTMLASGFSRKTFSGLEEPYGIWGVGFCHTQLWELLRMMIVEEDGDGLVLLQGIPGAWLKDGKSLKVKGICTYFGPLDLETISRADGKEIEVRITPPRREPPRELRLRCRHPDNLPIKEVSVNGRSHTNFSGDWITLPGQGDMRILVGF